MKIEEKINKKEVKNKTKERRTRPDHNDEDDDDEDDYKRAKKQIPECLSLFFFFDLNKLILQIEEKLTKKDGNLSLKKKKK